MKARTKVCPFAPPDFVHFVKKGPSEASDDLSI